MFLIQIQFNHPFNKLFPFSFKDFSKLFGRTKSHDLIGQIGGLFKANFCTTHCFLLRLCALCCSGSGYIIELLYYNYQFCSGRLLSEIILVSFDIITFLVQRQRSIRKFQKFCCSLPFDSVVLFNYCIPSQSDQIIHILLN